MQDFLLGSIATVFKPDREWKPEKMSAKADAGINFIQTQLCFDIDILRHYMSRLVAEELTRRIHVCVAPLPSADMAQWLGKNLRGAVMPRRIVTRLRQAADPKREGELICAELLSESVTIPGVAGANLMSLGDVDSIVESVNLAALR